MAAFWLARARIIDPVAYARYNEATKEASKNYPRRVLARGGRFQVLEGQTHYDRFVILEYPSFDAALDYFHSPGYQAAAELRRHGGGENEVVILDGIADPAPNHT
jgi:uncharacterized protein (DUF1330 family)